MPETLFTCVGKIHLNSRMKHDYLSHDCLRIWHKRISTQLHRMEEDMHKSLGLPTITELVQSFQQHNQK